MLHTNSILILRLMVRLHERGISMSFGEVQTALRKLDAAIEERNA